jgi:hypothetical protein
VSVEGVAEEERERGDSKEKATRGEGAEEEEEE